VSEESKFNVRDLVPWATMFASGLIWVAFSAGLIALLWKLPQGFVDIVKEHFVAVVGVPGAGLGSLYMVVMLEQTAGPVQFEGWGIKFSGATGQVVLWALCFLTIVAGLKVLW
jgi:hypothetical protein